MAKTFDATTKELIESNPGAWLYVLLGWDAGLVSLLNVELSTVTAEADAILKVEGPTPWIIHAEVQSSCDKSLPLRLLKHMTLIRNRHDLPDPRRGVRPLSRGRWPGDDWQTSPQFA